jgi:hypothetical protein
VNVELALSIGLFAIVVVGYFYAVGKVWRGESRLDLDEPAPWWPFSLPLWRGGARALPVQGASILLLLGAGITSDLIGSDSRYYDLVMSIGLLGLIGTIFLAFPIMYYNRPKLLVPPIWRDDPGAVAEWRAAREQRRPR